METKIAIVNRVAPHGTAAGRESLDAVLAISAFNESISVFFIQDGVFQLLKGQSPAKVLNRDYNPTFAMFDLYDIENIYVCASSLSERGLKVSDLSIDVTLLKTEQLRALLSEQDRLIGF